MDISTQEGKRLLRVAEALWKVEPKAPLAEAYKHFRGDTFGDFCTDLEDIVQVMESTAGKLDRRQKILDALVGAENSILVLFENRQPGADLWGQLLELTHIIDGEVEADSWICAGCERPTAISEHFMTTTIRLGTRVPSGYVPVRDVPETELQVRVHGPNCLVSWMANDGLLKNVFG
jgi:hypothetical protein